MSAVRHVRLNHTTVHAGDRRYSAEFLAGTPGPEVGAPSGPFPPVGPDNGVTTDHYEKRDEPVQGRHYAFLAPEERFGAVVARPEAAGVTCYAGPSRTEPGRVNDLFGGRGAHFDDPDGHNMEITPRYHARP